MPSLVAPFVLSTLADITGRQARFIPLDALLQGDLGLPDSSLDLLGIVLDLRAPDATDAAVSYVREALRKATVGDLVRMAERAKGR